MTPGLAQHAVGCKQFSLGAPASVCRVCGRKRVVWDDGVEDIILKRNPSYRSWQLIC